MGVEVVNLGDDIDIFDDPIEIDTKQIQTEEANVNLDKESTPYQQARRADSFWVRQMHILGELANIDNAVLELSDGNISHTVAFKGLIKGEDDYYVHYIDSWGTERGSFLQAGKNIAGCEAEELEPGNLIIPAEQLINVLDSAVTIRAGIKDESDE